jgi:hypothetical protein
MKHRLKHIESIAEELASFFQENPVTFFPGLWGLHETLLHLDDAKSWLRLAIREVENPTAPPNPLEYYNSPVRNTQGNCVIQADGGSNESEST